MLKNKNICLGLLMLAIALLLQSHPSVDYGIQNLFFNSATSRWVLQNESSKVKFVFYTMPKIMIILATLGLIFITLRTRSLLEGKHIVAFLFCMIFIPLVVGLMKSQSQIHCPYDLQLYGGPTPFRSLWEFSNYSFMRAQFGSGDCFPAGHASGGFAFMSSYFILDEKYKNLGVLIGFLTGSYMALYQMLRGAHFFSHSLFTFGFAVFVISLVNMYLKRSLEF